MYCQAQRPDEVPGWMRDREWEGGRRGEQLYFRASHFSLSTLVTFPTLYSLTFTPHSRNSETPGQERKAIEMSVNQEELGAALSPLPERGSEEEPGDRGWGLTSTPPALHFHAAVLLSPSFRLGLRRPWVGPLESCWQLRFQNSLWAPPREKGRRRGGSRSLGPEESLDSEFSFPEKHPHERQWFCVLCRCLLSFYNVIGCALGVNSEQNCVWSQFPWGLRFNGSDRY